MFSLCIIKIQISAALQCDDILYHPLDKIKICFRLMCSSINIEHNIRHGKAFKNPGPIYRVGSGKDLSESGYTV